MDQPDTADFEDIPKHQYSTEMRLGVWVPGPVTTQVVAHDKTGYWGAALRVWDCATCGVLVTDKSAHERVTNGREEA